MNRRQFFRATAAVTLAGFTFAQAAFATGPKRKILFFTKSSGFEHDVISYKKGQPSFAEKILTDLGAKNNWADVPPNLAQAAPRSSENPPFPPPAPAK